MTEMLFPIKVAGVPEHFNMPIHWAKAKGIFERDGIDLQWIDFPSGTGAMCNALRNNEIDIAIMLTEGALADIEKGNPSTILQFFTESPLNWGIHVAADNGFKNISDIKNKKFAISRKGSGSHLMAKVLASQQNFTISEEQFVIVNNLDGAIDSISKGESDVFLWEKFMTKPLVDKGIFRKIGEIPTPWSCFVIVARNQFIEENREALMALLGCINEATAKFSELKNKSTLIAEKYHLNENDVKDWLKTVVWNNSPLTNDDVLENVKLTLQKSGVL